MMNCFEARPQFVAFWRGTLDTESRGDLIAHLKTCSKCDRAFRQFALSAPMLHPKDALADTSGSAARAVNIGVVPRADATRAAEILRRASVYRLEPRGQARSWRGFAAGLSAVAAAVLLAYFSVAAPPQSFDDALTAAQSSTQSTSELFGQPMPEIPHDLVG